MIEELEGIILNEKDYGETSKILNILTKEHGVIGAISKGCKSIKSPLRSSSTKLTYGKFNLYYKQDKLSTLKSIDIIDSFKNIKKDILKISYASFLLELSDQVVKHSGSNVFDLLISSLVKINEGYDPLIITNILELKCLDFLGVMPVIDCCCVCGSTSSIATISSYLGGYVCNNCRKNEKFVSEKTIKLIRMFYYLDISKITKLDINDKIKNEINEFLDDYYDRYTGLYLKSKNFFNYIEKVIYFS